MQCVRACAHLSGGLTALRLRACDCGVRNCRGATEPRRSDGVGITQRGLLSCDDLIVTTIFEKSCL